MKRFLPILFVSGAIFIVLLALTYWKPQQTDVLDGSIWKVSDLNGRPLIKNSTLTIRFHHQKISGSSGCNTFKGSYEVESQQVSISILEATMDNCMNPGIMDQERAFKKFLQDVVRFSITGNELTLTSDNGDQVLFEAMLDSW